FSQFDRTRQRGDYSDPLEVWLSGRLVQGDAIDGSSCASSIRTVQDRRYLVFRDAEGNLLGEIRGPEQRYAGNRYNWPVYEEMLPNDPWLARVRKAAAKTR
ncbi:MAG: hypothetical protein K0R83_857, partial [Caulobacter sp.]|nr:hypothetical protein [Caulobacter sp.]